MIWGTCAKLNNLMIKGNQESKFDDRDSMAGARTYFPNGFNAESARFPPPILFMVFMSLRMSPNCFRS
jgi:hypothetical protein